MRRNAALIGLLLILLLILLWSGVDLSKAQSDLLPPVPSIYRIDIKGCQFEPKIRRQTGFRVEGLAGIMTTLHGVADCTLMDATADGGQEQYTELEIRRVDIAHDVVLLSSPELDDLPTEGLSVSPLSATEILTASLRIVGYPRGLEQQDIDLIESIREIESLDNVIPDAEEPAEFIKRKSPDLDIQVLNVQAQLLPGHSGAPLIDSENRVVAIGNGGLREGGDGRSWAIPWNDEWRDDGLQSVALGNVKTKLALLAQKDIAALSFFSTFPSQDHDTHAVQPYIVQVVDRATGQPIANAEVLLTYNLGYLLGLTDSEGFYRFDLTNDSRMNYAQSQLQVEAVGYKFYTRMVTDALTRNGPENVALQAVVSATLTTTATITKTLQPVSTTQAEAITDLRVLDESANAHIYLLEGADVQRFNVGDDLVVYGEPNPGIELAIASVKVVGKSDNALVVQALLIDPTFEIRTKMRVDDQLGYLSNSRLIPVFDYADGYLLRQGLVRLRPDHQVEIGATLQVLEPARINEEIIDALPSGTELQVTGVGVDGQVAVVALRTGEWPEAGAIVSLVEGATPVAPADCSFALFVLDEGSGDSIRGAKVSVIVDTQQETGVTDSAGYYRAQIPCSDGEQPEVRIRIFADGYESYTSSLYLSNQSGADQTEEIYLSPEGVPTPTVTPTRRATPTPTARPARFALGDWVEAAASSRLREYPGLTQTIFETLPRNEIFRIDGGPREADGYQWWQLRELDGTVRGWIAYDDNDRDPSLLPVREATPTPAAPVGTSTTPSPSRTSGATASSTSVEPTEPRLTIIKPQWGDSMNGPSEIRWRYKGQLGPNQGFDLMLWYKFDPIHRGIVDVSKIMQELKDYGNGEYGVTINVSSAPLVQQYCDASYLLYVVVVDLNPYERTGIESDMVDVRMRPIGGC